MGQFQVCVPPDGVADWYGEIVRHWIQMIRANAEKSHTLVNLRDILPPKLMSGEIGVGNAVWYMESQI